MSNDLKLNKSFFERPVKTVAENLLGQILVWNQYKAIITETEAYNNQDDEASHAFRGITPRAKLMYGEPGFLYVYLIYGMYHCLNVVTDASGVGSAVLIRGAKLIAPYPKNINGPGKLCLELGINLSFNGLNIIDNQNIYLKKGVKLPFIQTPRIGISKAMDKLWRFVAVG